MKTLYLLLLTCFSLNLAAQSKMVSYKNDDGKVHLLGAMERSDLEAVPYQIWLDSIYQAYKIDIPTIGKLNNHYDGDVEIKVFLGTWCGDSKREVSRFLKIADQSNIDLNKVEFICLDDRKETYKQGLNKEEKGYNIHRVPTFVFSKNDKEIGRIVEYPVTSLEMDMTQIYAGLAPAANYRLANEIGELFDEKSVVEVDTFVSQNIKLLKRKVSDEYELNTYGYVLLAANEFEKAKVVFKLNAKFFPKKGYVIYGLGRAHMANKEYELASENFMLAAELGGDYGYAKKKMKELILAMKTE